VVLSNNDGCIISRTDEARVLGVAMAGPFYQVKDLIKQHQVAVFSSNYSLYGDLSWRVMKTLKDMVGEDNVEVYSVDEAFLDLHLFAGSDLEPLAMAIRRTVEQWTGIKVSIGIAPTKTLAKMANRLAKRDKGLTHCITVLDTQEKIIAALKKTRVEDLWGVGRQYAEKLKPYAINTGWDLYHLSEEWMRRNLGGVVGVRLSRELHGRECVVMKEELKNKKMIATTRMFGRPVTELCDIKEAVATYTSRAAEKLRRQRSAASVINVFIVPRQEMKAPDFRQGATAGTHSILPVPTVLTQDLIKVALRMTERLYEKGRVYKKAGVVLSGLVPDSSIQSSLFDPPAKSIGRFLMEMVDNINFSMRDDVVKFASSGTKGSWKMRKDFHSPRYTTRWEELYEVE
jgi:DNA polymerase V